MDMGVSAMESVGHLVSIMACTNTLLQFIRDDWDCCPCIFSGRLHTVNHIGIQRSTVDKRTLKKGLINVEMTTFKIKCLCSFFSHGALL